MLALKRSQQQPRHCLRWSLFTAGADSCAIVGSKGKDLKVAYMSVTEVLREEMSNPLNIYEKTNSGSRDPTPHTGSPFPTLIHGEVLTLTTTWYAMFCWETSPFLKRNRGGVFWSGGNGNKGGLKGKNWN